MYRCPRTRRHLVLQMADEYYNSHNFGKALTLLTHMLTDFRNENWWLLLTDILEKALKCAYLTANIQDYLLLSLESLGRFSNIDISQKKKIHENLSRILKKQIPFGIQNFSPDLLQQAVVQWQPKLQAKISNLSLDLSKIISCIEAKARFLKAKYEVDQKISVEVFIRCTSPLPLTFSKVSVTVNTPTANSEFAVNDCNLEPKSLEFYPGKTKQFFIEFLADSCDLNSDIQVRICGFAFNIYKRWFGFHFRLTALI